MTAKPDDLAPDELDLPAEVLAQLGVIRQRHRDDPPLDQLRAAQAGVLPDGAQQAASAHLARDAWSRTLVDATEVASGIDEITEARLLARIRRELPQAPARPAVSWRSLAGPAAAAVLIAAAWLTPASRPDVASPAITEPVAVMPPATVAPAPTPEPPAFTKPEVRLGLRALTWRGPPNDNQYLLDLKPAFDAYRAGDHARAGAAFDRLAVSYPDALEVQFYRGVTRMLLGDFESALDPLRRAARLDDGTFEAEVKQLLTVAERRTNRLR